MRTGRAHLRKTILSESDSNYGERERQKDGGRERKKRGQKKTSVHYRLKKEKIEPKNRERKKRK